LAFCPQLDPDSNHCSSVVQPGVFHGGESLPSPVLAPTRSCFNDLKLRKISKATPQWCKHQGVETPRGCKHLGGVKVHSLEKFPGLATLGSCYVYFPEFRIIITVRTGTIIQKIFYLPPVPIELSTPSDEIYGIFLKLLCN
jgi:hypothetical protein